MALGNSPLESLSMPGSFSRRGSCPMHSNFDGWLKTLDPSSVVTISCIDYREQGRQSYLLTSAGNVVHPTLLEDLHLVLSGKHALVLRAHTDCAKSKREVPRIPGECDRDYSSRVEERTLQRLWQQARILLGDPEVQAAILNGLGFCVGRLDIVSGKTSWFQKASCRLVNEMTTGAFLERENSRAAA